MEFARWTLQHAEPASLTAKWGGGGPMLQYVDGPMAEFFTFGPLHPSGILESLWSLPYRCDRLGLPQSVWRTYWDGLLTLIPGSSIQEFRNQSGEVALEFVHGPSPTRSSKPPLQPLAEQRGEWLQLMQETAARIREAMSER